MSRPRIAGGAPATKRSVLLSDADWEALRKLGKGRYAQGVRHLLHVSRRPDLVARRATEI